MEELGIYVTVGPKPPEDQAFCRPGSVVGPFRPDPNTRVELDGLATLMSIAVRDVAARVHRGYYGGSLHDFGLEWLHRMHSEMLDSLQRHESAGEDAHVLNVITDHIAGLIERYGGEPLSPRTEAPPPAEA